MKREEDVIKRTSRGGRREEGDVFGDSPCCGYFAEGLSNVNGG